MFLQADNEDWFFFQLEEGKIAIRSSNLRFNSELSDASDDIAVVEGFISLFRNNYLHIDLADEFYIKPIDLGLATSAKRDTPKESEETDKEEKIEKEDGF